MLYIIHTPFIIHTNENTYLSLLTFLLVLLTSYFLLILLILLPCLVYIPTSPWFTFLLIPYCTRPPRRGIDLFKKCCIKKTRNGPKIQYYNHRVRLFLLSGMISIHNVLSFVSAVDCIGDVWHVFNYNESNFLIRVLREVAACIIPKREEPGVHYEIRELSSISYSGVE